MNNATGRGKHIFTVILREIENSFLGFSRTGTPVRLMAHYLDTTKPPISKKKRGELFHSAKSSRDYTPESKVLTVIVGYVAYPSRNLVPSFLQ